MPKNNVRENLTPEQLSATVAKPFGRSVECTCTAVTADEATVTRVWTETPDGAQLVDLGHVVVVLPEGHRGRAGQCGFTRIAVDGRERFPREIAGGHEIVARMRAAVIAAGWESIMGDW
jgi:hypothetical protein